MVQPESSDLLAALADGAEKPLYTPDAWAVRLNVDPLAAQFRAQLALEWLPAAPPDALGERMAAFVQDHLAGIYHGWPHLWAHTLRVTGTALALAPEAAVDPAHVYLLAIFHDVGKLEEVQTGVAHELTGALLTHKTLNGHLPADIASRIVAAVAKRGPASDPFVRVLHDADKLDKIGATGILRRTTTVWGANHWFEALMLVKSDLLRFPAMTYPTARRLAESKMAFTRLFLSWRDLHV